MRKKTCCFDEICMDTLLAQRKNGFQLNHKHQLSPPVLEQSEGWRSLPRGSLWILPFPSRGTGQGMLACHQRTLTSALLNASTVMRSKNPVKSGPLTNPELTRSDLKDLHSHIPVSLHQHRYEITKGKVAAMTIFFFSWWTSNLATKTSNLSFTKEGISTLSQQLTQD